jgi:hypothetical protein
MRTSGILVLNRFEFMRWAASAGGPVRRALALPLPLTRDEIFRRYRGLDGRVWPDLEYLPFELEDGLVDMEDLPVINQYVASLRCRDECDVIAIARSGLDFKDMQQNGWLLAGIDVGYFESEYSHFSVILHEVLLGTYEELRSFAGRLNGHLLLPSLADGRELMAVRARLAAQGKDVEHEPPAVEPIVVYIRQVT